jgi:hypothetical protein
MRRGTRHSNWILLFVILLTLMGTWASPAQATPLPPLRRVYVPHFADGVRWQESGIVWFGEVDPPSAPGLNYAEVRIATTDEALRLFLNIEDYFVWYKYGATPETDLTQYDAVAISLDTAHDRSTAPQTEDYRFLRGLCLYGCGDHSAYHRQARGTGTGWDDTWSGAWSSETWAQWGGCSECGDGTCGPNSDNSCGLNFGWGIRIIIPWSTLGLSGPPSVGTTWGLGVQLYDRDGQPPAGAVPLEFWPETFDAGRPDSWGEMVFGSFTPDDPQPITPQGTTVIRRGLGDSVVEDAWVGGGGTCGGGHEGDPDNDNHGSDSSLFVENQHWITDFPCFSKSYLRFGLDPIPAGKSILSATLTIHQWSNARWDRAQPSLITLFTVDGDWEEDTLTWNNAPLARENLSSTWLEVITPDNNPGLPGVPYTWDATQAVAEAYAAGEPLDVALYTADVNQHSSKYLLSSEAVPAYAEGRPTLTVVWGHARATLSHQVSPGAVESGEQVTYVLSMLGSGRPLTLTDDLPAQVGAPQGLQVTPGQPAPTYEPGTHRVTWSGTPTVGARVAITFPVAVQAGGPLAVDNTALLAEAGDTIAEETARFIVDGWQVWLPLTLRDG